MGKWYKSVISMAVVTVILGTLSGCSGSKDTAGKTSKHITLTMWQQWGGGHEESELKSLIKQYEALHPNITIEETPVTDNSKILTAISGGNPPDIIDLGGTGVIGQWASKGALTDLTPYIKKDKTFKKSNFIQSGWDSVTMDGKVYGIPFMNFDAALLYNKKLFAEAGITNPPTTLEELTEDAYKLTKIDSNGKITQAGFIPDFPGSNLKTFGWLFGGQWFDSKGNATGNNPQIQDAIKWEKQFYDKYGAQKIANFVKSSGAYLTAQDPFQSGKIAMVLDGPWVISYIEENNPDMAKNIGVVPLPAPANNSSTTGTTYVDTNPQIIPAGAKHPDEAWKFISWVTTNPKIAGEFATMVANLPQIKDSENFKLESNPLYKVFIDGANSSNAHAWPQTTMSSEFQTKLVNVEQDILYGKSNALKAMKDLDKEVNSSGQ